MAILKAVLKICGKLSRLMLLLEHASVCKNRTAPSSYLDRDLRGRLSAQKQPRPGFDHRQRQGLLQGIQPVVDMFQIDGDIDRPLRQFRVQ